jgi:hypothetical protein
MGNLASYMGTWVFVHGKRLLYMGKSGGVHGFWAMYMETRPIFVPSEEKDKFKLIEEKVIY